MLVSGQPESDPAVPRVRVANIANVLTGVRLVLVPIFLLFLFAGDGHESASRITAFVIFAVAVITDRLMTEFSIGAAALGLAVGNVQRDEPVQTLRGERERSAVAPATVSICTDVVGARAALPARAPLRSRM